MSEDFNTAGWDWITGFYEKPAIRSACLVLQDRHKADVTFLLFLCWLDRKNLKFSDHYLTINQKVAGQRRFIKMTRALRRFLSTFALTKKFSKKLLEKEINQEHRMFLALCEFERIKSKGEAVLAKQYIAYKGAIPTAAGRMVLKQLKV